MSSTVRSVEQWVNAVPDAIRRVPGEMIKIGMWLLVGEPSSQVMMMTRCPAR